MKVKIVFVLAPLLVVMACSGKQNECEQQSKKTEELRSVAIVDLEKLNEARSRFDSLIAHEDLRGAAAVLDSALRLGLKDRAIKSVQAYVDQDSLRIIACKTQ